MLIRSDDRTPWMSCKSCGTNFRMGSSCKCGSVRSQEIEGGAYLITDGDEDAVIDTE